MKHFITLVLAFISAGTSIGQHLPGRWQVGLQAGTFHYLGDLNYQGQPDWAAYRSFDANESPWALRAHLGRRLSPAWTWYLAGEYGYLLGADRARTWNGDIRSENPNLARALNVRTEIMSLQTGLRYHLANDQWLDLDAGWDPYMEIGVGAIQFTPFGDLLDGEGNIYHYWADGSIRDRAETAPNASESQIVERDRSYETRLSDLNTNTEVDYPRQTLIIPLGIGIRRRLGPGIWLNGNLRWQYTFSDYLDDASGAYPKGSDIPLENFAINPGGISTNSQERGNPDTKDSYLFVGMGIEWELGKMGKRFEGLPIYTGFTALPEQTLPMEHSLHDTVVLASLPEISPETDISNSAATETEVPSSTPVPDTTIYIIPDLQIELPKSDTISQIPLPIVEQSRESLSATNPLNTGNIQTIEVPLSRDSADSISLEEFPMTAIKIIPQEEPVTLPQKTEDIPQTPLSAGSRQQTNGMADSLTRLRMELLQLQVQQERIQRERVEADQAKLQVQNDSMKSILAAIEARQTAYNVNEAITRARQEQTYEADRAIDEILEKTEVPDMPVSATQVDTLPISTGQTDSLNHTSSTSDSLTVPQDSISKIPEKIRIQVGQTPPAANNPGTPPIGNSVVLPTRPAVRDTLVIQTEPAKVLRDTVVVYVPSKPDTVENIVAAPAEKSASFIGLARTSIHFDLGKHTFHPADTSILNQVLMVLQSIPDTDLQLEGYTDKRGSADLNMRLSQKRAEGVASYFTNRDINPVRIRIRYVGESQTRYTDGALDRRVDISLIPRAEGK